jgi:dTDP-4-amino-4,6-dideoxy-D-galactose acyltransferase
MLSMKDIEICQFLEWDSTFFGVNIARVSKARLEAGDLKQISQWCQKNNIDCLCLLADLGDQLTISLTEDYGFRLVDVRVTLECQIFEASSVAVYNSQVVIRPAFPQDVPALCTIARYNHRDSRFYYDVRFPTDRCDALYETWIENSCKGYADTVFVVETAMASIGYITCHLVDHNTGQIGLLGVAREFQGQGIGRRLVNESLRWFADQGVKQVRVVTQGRNVNAQRLYGRSGFLPYAMQLWYHYWFSDGGSMSKHE